MFMQLHKYSEIVSERVDRSARVHFSGDKFKVFIGFAGVTLHNVKNHEIEKH